MTRVKSLKRPTKLKPHKEHCRELDNCWMTLLASKWISQMISKCFLPGTMDTVGFNHKTNVTVILGLFTDTKLYSTRARGTDLVQLCPASHDHCIQRRISF